MGLPQCSDIRNDFWLASVVHIMINDFWLASVVHIMNLACLSGTIIFALPFLAMNDRMNGRS